MKNIWFEKYELDMLNGMRNANMAGHLGIEFLEIGDDYLKARMPVDERTKQAFGILHGGASCVLSETLGSVSAWMAIDPTKHRAVGIEINANHLRSASEGFVTGICKPIRIGRSLHVWNTEIFGDNDKMTCTSRLTVSIQPK
ncbi:MAG: hotdog fold thioesterase [Alphaproteobacteria bacterium]|nr:hotdog fold thioesterase [Alphaproteobacteria bacterium]NCQ88338.1 hotdog fold thioesterase [Alphaproteobacteria bacterium]NCT05162.1 hotdog fold thioesterase [Alphaproteobacteria bacterium]